MCDANYNDCNGVVHNGLAQVEYFIDADGDGFGDANAIANTNCAQPTGYVADNTDCLDSNPAVNSNASEVCGDGIDNNCNGNGDENSGAMWYADADGDGYGNVNSMISACTQPIGYVANSTDCNDTNAALTVSTPEVCDGLDNDCDGVVDDGVTNTYYSDGDSDGFGTSANSVLGCSLPIGFVANSNDCNDNAAAINPSAVDVCGNGIDEDCSGADATCGTPGCTNVDACNFDPLATIDNGSCVLPEFETCDGVDNDCDGVVDDGVSNTYYADVDGDGLGNLNNTIQLCSLIPGFVSDSSDCDDTDSNLLGPGFACDNGNVLDTLDTFQADCSCQGLLFGCTDMVACNYDENATYDDSTCTYSSFVPSSIEGDSLVLPFTQAHQYAYPDTIPGLSFQWTLNALGVFIPNSSIDTSSVVTVFWSNATSTIPEGLITLTITDNNCGPNTTFTLTYNVVFDTTNYSVGEAELGQLVVWPNPSRGEVSVDVPEDIVNDYEILVVDLLGQVVYSEKAQQESIWKGNLNLSSGIYVLKLIAENRLYTVPLIIEN